MIDLTVRQLGPADAEQYRRIRLEALATDPDAFSSTFAAENARPLAWFADCLEEAIILAAFCGADLVGVAGLSMCSDARTGTLWGMYVRSHARRRGIGRGLVDAVIKHVRGRVDVLQLNVVPQNRGARRFYANCGFSECGMRRLLPWFVWRWAVARWALGRFRPGSEGSDPALTMQYRLGRDISET
ncbi:MAG TPA: GNAT family N-acetyltransferase [Stellaceae bacterium]|nr:GNAT family N-acetyltransferase [Stellaceae bacterium]HEV2334824.1 GNAT family N-acetyltransferase [Stellaceae bacterium]